jgi:hypothetical protein
VHHGTAISYLCDGRRIEAWLRGTAADGKLNLTGPHGASLTGTYAKGLAAGFVTANGRRLTFAVPQVHPPSGLYRATAKIRNARVVAGWIVLPGGAQVGVVDTDGTPAPAPRLDTSTGRAEIDGTPVTARPVDDSEGGA